ncbi:MAG TPA: NAD(P)H-dependent oxidoreductase [Lutibacter sp.]
MTKNIVTIGGSSSKNSINKRLAEYAGGLLKNATLTKVDLNDYGMPLFSVDLEQEIGFPKGALELNELIENTDGFVISLAEHNGAYSAAFKNTFDWLSRINGKVWRNKPMLLLSTSTGIRGGQSVLNIALNRFPFNGGNIVGSMPVPSFNENFKDDKIINAELKINLQILVDEFEKELL